MNCPKTGGNYVRQFICIDKIMQIFHGIKTDRQRCVRNIIRNLAYKMQEKDYFHCSHSADLLCKQSFYVRVTQVAAFKPNEQR